MLKDKDLRQILVVILAIQDLDMQMMQLMRLKKERKKELDQIHAAQDNLRKHGTQKESVITEVKAEIRHLEADLADISERSKKLDARQGSIKKVEEFNALTNEMAQVEREKVAKESKLSDCLDRLALEEDALKNVHEQLRHLIAESVEAENAILSAVREINNEGLQLSSARDALALQADSEVLSIYERLLRNKRDRVVVPIENRCCSGCHIMLTAQDENLVRKGERLIFCEHCSRIHYWQEAQEAEGMAKKTRRRRTTTAAGKV